ncbi:hypothetical protein ACFV6G_35915 [Streptomyces lavendulae]|uniref:hypothetical protein n=1 Tax=Streptomyces lavendulae TaxID=1914 RepID=UPI0036B7411C
MTKRHPDPDGPDPDWRALLAALPDGDDDPPPGTSRRRWRQTRRRAARQRRADTITAVRARPVHPAALLLVLLLVLALGVLARCDSRPQPGDDRPPAAVPSAAPTAAPAPVPVPTVPADTGPDSIAAEWVRAYLSRDPVADQSHRPSVRRAASWAVPELTQSLIRQAPPGWGRQVSRGEATRVTATAVRPAGDDLPPDSPAQVWRAVTATVQATGYETATRAEVLRVEIMRTTAGWRVSRALGV